MKKYYTLFAAIDLLSVLGIAAMYLNGMPFGWVAGLLLITAVTSSAALVSMDGTGSGC
jgi:hypothetical protein